MIAASALAAANAIQMGSLDQSWTGHTNFYLKESLDAQWDELTELYDDAIADGQTDMDSTMADIDTHIQNIHDIYDARQGMWDDFFNWVGDEIEGFESTVRVNHDYDPCWDEPTQTMLEGPCDRYTD